MDERQAEGRFTRMEGGTGPSVYVLARRETSDWQTYLTVLWGKGRTVAFQVAPVASPFWFRIQHHGHYTSRVGVQSSLIVSGRTQTGLVRN